MKRLLNALLASALLAGCATTGSNAKDAAPVSSDPYQQGLQAKKDGKTDEAMSRFRAALAADHHRLDAWRSLVQLYAETGRLSEITGELKSKLAAEPNDDALHYALGLAEFANPGQAGGEAIGEFKRAAELRPAEAEYPFRQGVALLESERYPEAIPPLRKAVELAPNQAKYHVPLGLCLARQGDRPGALTEFRTLLQLKPSGRDVQLAQKALDRLEDPMRDVPKSEEDNVKKGMDWLQRADQPQQAIDSFQDVLDRYPDLAPVHTLIGLAYERLDDSGPAVEHFRRAMELKPEAYEPYLYLAELYLAKQKPEQADGLYRQALERNPLSDLAYRRLGELAVQRADAEAAQTNFRALVVLRPDEPLSYKYLAQGLELAGRYDEAEQTLKELIEREPRDLDAKLRLGYLYMALMQRTKEAGAKPRYRKLSEEAFQKVLDAQPENVAASRALKELRAGG